MTTHAHDEASGANVRVSRDRPRDVLDSNSHAAQQATSVSGTRPVILYFVTEDWYFYSHRLPIARAARQNGFDVHVLTQVGPARDKLLSEGFSVHPLRMSRSGLNPIREISVWLQILRVMRLVKPDILHNVAMKPVIYGTLAARCVGSISVVNALAGLGFVFSSSSAKAKVLKPLIRLALRVSIHGAKARTIVQNREDQRLLRRGSKNPASIVVIQGSGVDTQKFVPVVRERQVPVVALVARLLRDKGVYEFVHAARDLQQRGVAARFVLIGEPDSANPASVPDSDLKSWRNVVEQWGWSDDMAQTLQEVDIVALPSYREGLPKCLLEAASSGLAIVTTDTPGCRDVVLEGTSGYLVPVKDAAALAEAMQRLLDDPGLRLRMGARGRERVVERFSEVLIIEQTLAVYNELRRCLHA